MYYTSLRAMIHYSTYQALTTFLSQVVAVYFVALVASLFIEMPLRRLERFLLFRQV